MSAEGQILFLDQVMVINFFNYLNINQPSKERKKTTNSQSIVGKLKGSLLALSSEIKATGASSDESECEFNHNVFSFLSKIINSEKYKDIIPEYRRLLKDGDINSSVFPYVFIDGCVSWVKNGNPNKWDGDVVVFNQNMSTYSALLKLIFSDPSSDHVVTAIHGKRLRLLTFWGQGCILPRNHEDVLECSVIAALTING